MSENTSNREPSPTYLEVKKEIEGYEVVAGFYPGFVRAIEVNGVSLYEQKADGPYPFYLPPDGPLTSSVLTLSSSKGYKVELNLGSTQSMDQLQLVLHPPRESKGGGVTAFQDLDDRWSIFNTVVYCPPFC
ncbi:hypothetical protein SAMN05216486_1202 [bacterium JGI 053]|nr:hypothetical protein SAMN05216486_1202 [bacterium JGI 053]